MEKATVPMLGLTNGSRWLSSSLVFGKGRMLRIGTAKPGVVISIRLYSAAFHHQHTIKLSIERRTRQVLRLLVTKF
ncbi:MAG: hypothetical protein NPIRA04_24800 [Nitrospirales bacterium]|nr:MAG: hypothetical protein NPIRA04_24800 [Nitrospirales bacterium]